MLQVIWWVKHFWRETGTGYNCLIAQIFNLEYDVSGRDVPYIHKAALIWAYFRIIVTTPIISHLNHEYHTRRALASTWTHKSFQISFDWSILTDPPLVCVISQSSGLRGFEGPAIVRTVVYWLHSSEDLTIQFNNVKNLMELVISCYEDSTRRTVTFEAGRKSAAVPCQRPTLTLCAQLPAPFPLPTFWFTLSARSPWLNLQKSWLVTVSCIGVSPSLWDDIPFRSLRRLSGAEE